MQTTELNRWIEAQLPAALELLREMVAINSWTRNPAGVNELARLTAERFAPLGFSAEYVPSANPDYGNHLVLTCPGRSIKSLALVSHLDTVFPPEEEARNHFHWQPEGDRIYGPGTHDIKGGTAMMWLVLAALREHAPAIFESVTWRLFLDSSEETSSFDFGELCRLRCDGDTLAALVFEAEGRSEGARRLVIARKGRATWRVSVAGRGAHAGSRHPRGANAIVQLGQTLQRVAALTDYSRDLTVNIGTVGGGNGLNRVPHEAWAEGELRAFKPEIFAKAKADLLALSGPGDVRSGEDGFTCEVRVEFLSESRPWPRNAGTDALMALWQDTGEEVGEKLQGEERGGLSDGNLLWDALPTIDGLGPWGDNDHCSERSADGSKLPEYVEISSFVPKAAVNTLAIARLIKAGGAGSRGERARSPGVVRRRPVSAGRCLQGGKQRRAGKWRPVGFAAAANCRHSGIVESPPPRLSIRSVPDNDCHNSSSDPGVTPPAAVLPPFIDSPVIPPPLPVAARRGLRPWAIVGICVVGVGALLVLGAVMVGVLMAGQIKQQRTAQANAAAAADAAAARRRGGERTVAMEARAFGATDVAGVSYTNVTVPDIPWSIHVLRIDRSRKDLTFYAAHAGDRVLGVSLLADQARAVPREIGRTIAAVNGDFYVRDDFTYAGDPRGLQIVNGELLSAPDTFSVRFDTDGNPHLDEVKADFNVTWPDGRKTRFGLNQQRDNGMAVLYTPTYGSSTRVRGGRDLILERDGDGPWLPLQAGQTYRARVRAVRTGSDTPLVPNTMVLSLGPELLAGVPAAAPGAVLQISTATAPDLKGARAAIGGGPALIRNGKPFARTTPPPQAMRDYSQRSKYERHPRSAVGWSPTHVYLITVDGRQPGLSMGMKLAELAEFMADLGCTEAMNFDGGKSAQMWLNGRIVNSPCQGEDTVANSLLVIRKPEAR